MKSKVYLLKLNEIERIEELLPELPAPLGLKCHFGEEGNDAYVSAELIKKIASMLDFPPLLETTVLYRSERSKASSHRALALRHGFGFAPIDILDGEEGDDFFEYQGAGETETSAGQTCYLGKNLQNYKSLMVVSHFKGHIAAGFGGAIKNLSMGLASRRGKLDMHAGVKHQVVSAECVGCGVCIDNCPVQAISFNDERKATIDQDKCISCSKCIAVCPVSAIKIPWGTRGKDEFQGRLADYALAATSGRQCFYVNFLIDIVPQCDCMGMEQERMTENIGILVSTDPVAIDQASFDLVTKQCPEFKAHDGTPQLARAEAIGLGNREYDLEVL